MPANISYDVETEKPISGSITAVSQTINFDGPNSGTEVVQLTGTWVGTLIVEGSADGTTFVSLPIMSQSSMLFVASITANGSYLIPSNAYFLVRIRSSAWTSGTATVSVYGSNHTSIVKTDTNLRGATDGTQIGNAGDKLRVTDGLKNGGVEGNLNLVTGGTTYEAKVGGSRLPNRRSLTITALNDMYWGYNNTVTTSSGTPLYKNQTIIFAIESDSTFQVWLVASANNKDARITEST